MTNSPEMRALDPVGLAAAYDAGRERGVLTTHLPAMIRAYLDALSATHAQRDAAGLEREAMRLAALDELLRQAQEIADFADESGTAFNGIDMVPLMHAITGVRAAFKTPPTTTKP